MMIQKLYAILNQLAARRQRQRLHGGLGIVWWSGVFLGWLLWAGGVAPNVFVPVLAAVLFIASVAIFFWSRRGLGNPRVIAKHIEAKHPELQTALLAALDQKPGSGPFTYLQSRVVLETLASAERDHWVDIVPRPRLTGLKFLHLIGILVFLVIIAIALKPPASDALQAAESPAAAPVLEFTVDPGDVEIERGSPLTIQARFGTTSPTDAALEITDESGAIENLPLTRPFTDPVYQARISAVAGPLQYRVVTASGASRSYSVRVFDLPALQSSQVVLHFPEHFEKPPETIKDPRVIQAVEGTRMDLTLTANLPGLTASLTAKDKEPLEMTADSTTHFATIDLTESIRYEIVLTDSAGRRNSRKDVLDIKVIPNKPPVVKVVLPQKNEKASPIQEIRLEAIVTDDTGLLAQGLRYTLDGEKWQEIDSAATDGEFPPLSHLIDLESAEAKPNDLLLWNAWAEDIGPDGKKRRVNGDIHLVRVREFDEEFYQITAPPGGGTCMKLIKIQTNVLTATWTLCREHAEIADTPPSGDELETLRRSQEIAIGMAAEMEAQETDPSVRQILTDARLAMKDALPDLSKARDETSVAPLEPAIDHEQTALRHLYQLMGSKTMLITSEGEGESSSEPPTDELDLKPMENPYQAEKQAKPESMAGEAAEAMEILKRLEDLAKRQRDLNEEMQALQAALNEAATPEQKAEVEPRLKQLREQQRELLADVDTLREKTNDPAQKTTEQRQSEALNEAREKAQQANEQLNENKLGEALAAGRRAQESLEELHDDFRETSAAQLASQLRELRQDARALEERQRALGQSPEQPEASRPPGLSDATADNDLTRQREDLEKLLEAMRQTAESAEQAEPLVAQDLAEALRQADQNRVAQALEQMEQAGQDSPAAERAAEGIAELTRSIESATERILGNEAQALRYARDELQRLAEQASGETGKPQESGQSPGEGESKEQAANKPGEGKQPGEGDQPGETAGGQGEGEKPGQGDKPGEGQGEGAQPYETASNNPGEGDKPGEGMGEGQGQGQGEGSQPGETASNSPGQGDKPGESGQGTGEGQSSSETPGGEGRGQSSAQNSSTPSGSSGRGVNSPITGTNFEEWSDRLYGLEAIIEDPDAQSDLARARQAARDMRRDFKRHSIEPGLDTLNNEIVRPLAEAAKKLDARLREIDREDPLAPVGRDPVPDRYNEIVRRYFEELGK